MTSDKYHRKMVFLLCEFLCAGSVYVYLGTICGRQNKKPVLVRDVSFCVDLTSIWVEMIWDKCHRKIVLWWCDKLFCDGVILELRFTIKLLSDVMLWSVWLICWHPKKMKETFIYFHFSFQYPPFLSDIPIWCSRALLMRHLKTVWAIVSMSRPFPNTDNMHQCSRCYGGRQDF